MRARAALAGVPVGTSSFPSGANRLPDVDIIRRPPVTVQAGRRILRTDTGPSRIAEWGDGVASSARQQVTPVSCQFSGGSCQGQVLCPNSVSIPGSLHFATVMRSSRFIRVHPKSRDAQIQDSNLEIRNEHEGQKSKMQNSSAGRATVFLSLGFGALNLFRIWGFDIRISPFNIPSHSRRGGGRSRRSSAAGRLGTRCLGSRRRRQRSGGRGGPYRRV
jgi:hypothetical protein